MPDNTTNEQIKTEQTINSLKEKNKNLQRKIEEYSRKTTKNIEGSNKAAGALATALKDMSGSFQQIGAVWLGSSILPSITGMVKELVNTSKELHRNIINAGMFGDKLTGAKNIVTDLQANLGATYQDAAMVVQTLAQKQYVGNLKEAAESSYQLARATGLSYEEITKTTVALQKEGQIGTRATTAMYADLLKIQQANGLTRDGMNSTLQAIVKMSGNMRAFGKTETEIRRMAASTGKFVSSLEKVGVAASNAIELLDRMTDPTRIEENIGAYSQLGISISDALSGSVDVNQLQNGLKEFGQKLKQMGPIAGAAYAKSFGISYKDAIKAADMQGATEEILTPEESAAESLKQLTENTKNMAEKIGDQFNKFLGKIYKLGPVILSVIALLMPVFKDFVNSIFDEAHKRAVDSSKEISETYKSSNSKLFNDLLRQENDFNDKKLSNYIFMVKAAEKERVDLEAKFAKKNFSYSELAGAKDAAKQAGLDILDALKRAEEEGENAIKNLEKKKKVALMNGMKDQAAQIDELINKEIEGYDKTTTELKKQADIVADIYKKLNDKKPKLNPKEKLGIRQKRAEKEFANKINAIGTKITLPNGEVQKIGRVKTMLEASGKYLLTSARNGAVFIKDGIKNGAKNLADSVSSLPDKIKSGFLSIPKKLFGSKKKKEKTEDVEDEKTKKRGGFLKGGVVAILIGLLSKLISSMGNVTEVMDNLKNNVLDKLKSFFTKLQPALQRIFEVISTVLGALLETLGPALADLVTLIVEEVAGLLETLLPIIMKIIPVLKSIFEVVGKVITAVMPIVESLLEIIMNVLVPVLKIISFVLKVLTPLLKLLCGIINVLLWPIKKISEFFAGGKTKDELALNNDLLKENNKSLEKNSEKKPQELSTDKNGLIWIKKATNSSEESSSRSSTTASSGVTNSTSETADTKSSSTTTLDFKGIMEQNRREMINAFAQFKEEEKQVFKQGWNELLSAFSRGFNVVLNKDEKSGKIYTFGDYRR